MCYASSMSVMYIGMGVIQLGVTDLDNDLCIGLGNERANYCQFLFSFLLFRLLLIFSNSGALCLFGHLHLAQRTQFRHLVDVQVRSHQFPFLPVMRNFNRLDACRNLSGFVSDRRSRPRENLGRQFVFYSFYAWTVPLLFVGFGQVSDNVKEINKKIVRPGFGVSKCWFHCKCCYDILYALDDIYFSFDSHSITTAPTSVLTYLYGPMAVLILVNGFFFILTAVILCRAQIDSHRRMNNASLYYTKQK